MTIAEAGERDGVVRLVTKEAGLDTDEPMIEFVEREGKINPDLAIGVDVTRSKALVANDAICSPGVKLHGDGFIVTREKAHELGLGKRPGLDRHIREYRNGRDLTSRPRGVMVIDLFGTTADEVRREFPEVYQHLLETVRSQRADTFAKSPTKDAQDYLNRWWVFGKPRTELRPALEELPRYIATVETTKHRIFQFMEAGVLPDNMLVAIASDDPFHLGVLASRAHLVWAANAGGTLEDRPRYTKSRCFDPFPFPDATGLARAEIGAIAEELDETRKRVLIEHSDLTLTALYNVLEAVRTGAALSRKDQDVRSRGRVLILRELHDRLDAAVAKSYGWHVDIDAEQILDSLVRLNEVRAGEERRGFIKWLRPEYQIDKVGPLAHRGDRVQAILATKVKAKKTAFPVARLDQARVVLDLMARAQAPLSAEEIAVTFTSSHKTVAEVRDVLQSLLRLGQAESYDEGRSFFRTA